MTSPFQLGHYALMEKGLDDTLTVPLPVELYDAVGEKLGRETARAMLHAIEHSIALSTATLWHKNRHEIFQQLRQEFVTRELFEQRLAALEERMNSLRHELKGDIATLREKTEKDKAEVLGLIHETRAELLGKIEAVRLALDRKMSLFFFVLLAVILFTNRETFELVARMLGLLH